jgi:hypothetical protein
MGTRSRRIANNWLQAAAKPRLTIALTTRIVDMVSTL